MSDWNERRVLYIIANLATVGMLVCGLLLSCNGIHITINASPPPPSGEGGK